MGDVVVAVGLTVSAVRAPRVKAEIADIVAERGDDAVHLQVEAYLAVPVKSARVAAAARAGREGDAVNLKRTV